MKIHRPLPWLGGLTASEFMRRHWQRKPLFVKAAFPHWRTEQPPVSADRLLKLFDEGALPSRLLLPDGRLLHGPLPASRLPKPSRPNWTILVQQINTADQAADEFLNAFRFIPEARLDDLMISLASEGGGIGAHVDSYDVFLIQAQGVRQWEIARTFDPTLDPSASMRVLQHFEAEQSWNCEPGDLLYLPPGIAHRGTARTPGCMTYSVGFRTVDPLQVADEAFAQRADVQPSTSSAAAPDPWLKATSRPGEVPEALMESLLTQAQAQLPTRSDLQRALLIKLSEPHPEVFCPPPRPISLTTFRKRLASGQRLALRPGARLMVWKRQAAANGELLALDALSKAARTVARRTLMALANDRELNPDCCLAISETETIAQIFLSLFLDGTIEFRRRSSPNRPIDAV
ncbi:MAG TPA: cupin domain-containing protein [Burkholderiaceae bacterium]|nr:cupin domain-containing protein [Burkholderiaceae bacterium]